MIRYTTGNILDAPAEALVNTVNEVGVMGKGVALMFREAFPDNARAYEAACKSGEVRVGRMFVTENPAMMGPRWIINFPTKRHWRHPSQMDWIRDGLVDLLRVVREHAISSVALPPLGCGNGGLVWEHVRREIEAACAQTPDVEYMVYGPSDEYHAVPKRRGLTELTPARALVAEMVRRYCSLGMDCSVLEVQKLVWFLHRTLKQAGLPDPLKLTFVPRRYGPYADGLRHLLDGLDGSFLHCDRRLADARPYDLIWFDMNKQAEVARYLSTASAAQYRGALERASAVVDGFETPLGLELLATVDWLLAVARIEPNLASVKAKIAVWPGGRGAGARKAKLFDDRLIALALERLASSGLMSYSLQP